MHSDTPGQTAAQPARARGSGSLPRIAAGVALGLFMAGMLILGLRNATQLRGEVEALQTVSLLQEGPDLIAERLSTLRDRLEAHAYLGQALGNLRNVVASFNADLQKLHDSAAGDLPELSQAESQWRQFAPLINPVIGFTGQAYADKDDSDVLTQEGARHYHDVKQAQLFANDNARPLQASFSNVATALRHASVTDASTQRLLLIIGVLGTCLLTLVAATLGRTPART